MRYQLISLYYDFYIKQIYTRYPELAGQTYEEQHAAFWNDRFNWANYLCEELPKHGYETQHIVANIEPMQKRWAQERGVAYSETNWRQDILLAQIKEFKPDILSIYENSAFIQRVRDEVPSVRLMVGWAGEPVRDANFFKKHDLILTCVPEHVDYYRSAGIKSDLLHHAFDAKVLSLIVTPNKTYDVGFIGNAFFGTHAHNQRVKLINKVAQQIAFVQFGLVSTLGGNQFGKGFKYHLGQFYERPLMQLERVGLSALARHFPRYQVAQYKQSIREYKPVFDALRQRSQPPVFGLEMYRVLSSFKICFNAHAWSAYASNMRLYEATGVGTCLLTDWKLNIAALFEPDIEIVTYRSAEEAVEKARYLLNHDQEREAIASAGQRRTLRDHSLEKRAQEWDAAFRHYL